MKSIIIFLSIILFQSCFFNEEKSKNNYPENIKTERQKRQFDIAKFESYKIIGGSSCDCKGIYELENSELDTIFLLNANLKLLNIAEKKDTTTFYLAFFTKSGDRLYNNSKKYGECFNDIGIVFIDGSLNPMIALIDDEASIDLVDKYQNEKRFQNLKYCLEEKRKNRWLNNYLMKNK